MSSTVRRITFTERGVFLTADTLIGPVPMRCCPAETLTALRECAPAYIDSTELRVQVGQTISQPTGVRRP